MHRSINTIFLLFLTSLLIAQSKKNSYEEIWADISKNNFKKAQLKVDQLLDKNPKDFQAYLLKGEIFIGQSDIRSARAHYEAGLAKFPRNPGFFNERANFYKKILEFDHAIRDLDRAMELASTDTLRNHYLTNRGVAKIEKRDFHGAYEDLMISYAFDSTNIVTLTNLGALVDEIGREDETFFYLEKVIEIRPDFAPAYGNIGFRYQTIGKHEEAIKYFDKVLELKPNDPLGFNNRSYSKMKLGDLKGAMRDVQKSLEIYPGNAYAYRNRALIYLELKKKEKACDDLHRAEQLGFTTKYGDELKLLIIVNCL
ncbi:MAG: tetratricopeptide repeat protein [Bacteroidia bacterium]|nr:tetratricopeptide repeat protein [Bacteroidia bacterium]